MVSGGAAGGLYGPTDTVLKHIICAKHPEKRKLRHAQNVTV